MMPVLIFSSSLKRKRISGYEEDEIMCIFRVSGRVDINQRVKEFYK